MSTKPVFHGFNEPEALAMTEQASAFRLAGSTMAQAMADYVQRQAPDIYKLALATAEDPGAFELVLSFASPARVALRVRDRDGVVRELCSMQLTDTFTFTSH